MSNTASPANYRVSHMAENLIGSEIIKLAGEIRELMAKGEKIYNFTIGDFDPKIFPFAWMFASYGGFLGHYTVILEPCTTMPMSVNEAALNKQCSILQPGETLTTRVSIRAGRIRP